jgi:hypothetical protein
MEVNEIRSASRSDEAPMRAKMPVADDLVIMRKNRRGQRDVGPRAVGPASGALNPPSQELQLKLKEFR